MSRIHLVDPTEASGEAKELLDAVQNQLGSTPNFLRALASSPPALAGVLEFNSHLARGRLDAATRERIALAVSESNGCEYCVSAHSALAAGAGLDSDEIDAARRGGSADKQADAAVKFARALLDHQGDVTTGEIDAVRAVGYGDAEIVEIIALVGMNVLTNFLGKAGRIDVDFPKIALLAEPVAVG